MPRATAYTAEYWQVEHALAAAFGIAASSLPKFRSRIGELQRQGVLGVQPGKGTKLVYSADLFHRFVFALQLSQFGLPPTIIHRVIRDHWDTQLNAIFRDAVKWFGRAAAPTTQNDDVVMAFRIRLLTEGAASAVPTITSSKLSKLPQRVELTMRRDAEPLLLFNVTQRMRQFHDSLAAVTNAEEPKG